MNRFYKLILTTIALTIIVKCFLPEVQTNSEGINAFWSTKTEASSNYDIIACGDSRIYRGISANVLDPLDDKLSFINLGYRSAGLSDKYLDFVVSKFRPDAKNKILIVGITPHSLTSVAFKNEALDENLKLSKLDKFRYKYLSEPMNFFVPYKLSEVLNRNKVDYQQSYEPEGWVASYKLSPDSTFALKSYEETFSDYQVTDEEVNSSILALKKIASTGIKILAFRPPTTQQMEVLEDSMSGFNEEFVKRELVRHSINWFDVNSSNYTSYDGSHLDVESARRLSREIGEKIKEVYF